MKHPVSRIIKLASAIATLSVIFLSCSADKLVDRGITASVNRKYDKAFRLFEKAAKKDNAYAQYRLGECYEEGKGVRKNNSEAARWYKKAAEKGRADAQFKIGCKYADGIGVTKNTKEAQKWLLKSANQGYMYSEAALGWMYLEGIYGVSRNSSEAAKWLRRAANKGHTSSKYRLACLLKDNHDSEAIRWFENLCGNYPYYEEDGKAGIELGNIYENGLLNAKKDLDKAKDYYSRVADNNQNSDVRKNAKEKLNQLNRYIDNNAFYIGSNYYYGRNGYVSDKYKAVNYWTKAANNGNVEAQYNLGLCYSQGLGVPINKKKAFDWYLAAAQRGNRDAQYNVGCYYYEGTGVSKDRYLAKQWWQKAADQGDPDAKEALRQMNMGRAITGGLLLGGAALIANAISNSGSSSNKNSAWSKNGFEITDVDISHDAIKQSNGTYWYSDFAMVYYKNRNSYSVWVRFRVLLTDGSSFNTQRVKMDPYENGKEGWRSPENKKIKGVEIVSVER